MFFEDVTEKIFKESTYQKFNNHLMSGYKKVSDDLFREILQNGSFEEAMQKADGKYSLKGNNTCNVIWKDKSAY